MGLLYQAILFQHLQLVLWSKTYFSKVEHIHSSMFSQFLWPGDRDDAGPSKRVAQGNNGIRSFFWRGIAETVGVSHHPYLSYHLILIR